MAKMGEKTMMAVKDFDIKFSLYFPKGVVTIGQLLNLIKTRRKLLMQVAPPAITQIDEIALPAIIRSLDIIGEKHTALIKLLNLEEFEWTALKDAINRGDRQGIKRTISAILGFIQQELRLIPVEPMAQLRFVKMTPKEMEEMVGVP